MRSSSVPAAPRECDIQLDIDCRIAYIVPVTARASYSIGDLAAAAGVSRRTVRFYVQRELLPPPEGLGRGARYTDRHLARLLQIKGWQEQGVPLGEIGARLSGEREIRADSGRSREARRSGPAPSQRESWRLAAHADTPGTAWFRQPLVAGFELNVAAGRRPLTARQLAALARALGEILEDREEDA